MRDELFVRIYNRFVGVLSLEEWLEKRAESGRFRTLGS